jgi:endonuclease/exonuclease/phosphatase family metal-dependent hydrolase
MRSLSLLLLGFVLAGSAHAEPIRVMSYNIRYGTAQDGINHWDKRRDFLMDTILAFRPDLLGTQETLSFQRDFLAKKLPGFGVHGVGRDDGKEAGEMMAMYYNKDRFKLLDSGHFWLSETPDQAGSKSWDSSLPRMASWLKLQDLKAAKSTPPILFVNTHFDHRGPTARTQSARLIRSQLLKLGKDCQLIVTGDFNAGEASEPYQALFAKAGDTESPVVDSFRVKNPKRGTEEGTATGFLAEKRTGARIDWIAVSRDWTIVEAKIDRTAKEGRTPSDHFAVTAVLDRPGQK